jgi:hypothetical protein
MVNIFSCVFWPFGFLPLKKFCLHGTGTKTHEEQWNRKEGPDMNPDSFAHLVFDKGAQNI